mgnify:CR=1 FL=1|jgi:hypothetical protein
MDKIKCHHCSGTGMVAPGAVFTGASTQCKVCGFTALGQTQVKQFQKRGNLCRECSGDYDYS